MPLESTIAALADRLRARHPDTELTRLTDAELAALRRDQPRLPSDYLAWLGLVGWGNIHGIMVYSGPLAPDDVFDAETAAGFAGIELFADDMAGCSFGFDLGKPTVAVVSIDQSDPAEVDSPSFLAWLTRWCVDT